MSIAILIYFGIGAAVAVWAFTGNSDNAELAALRAKAVKRLGMPAIVVITLALWPWMLASSFIGAWRDIQRGA